VSCFQRLAETEVCIRTFIIEAQNDRLKDWIPVYTRMTLLRQRLRRPGKGGVYFGLSDRGNNLKINNSVECASKLRIKLGRALLR